MANKRFPDAFKFPILKEIKNHRALEYNFDGLPGPTHNYAGLSFGNRASMENKHKISNPQAGALEGLQKMKFLMDKGFKQALLPPQERPNLLFLKKLGFTGSVQKILSSAWSFSPSLLASCYSASSMWTANSALFSPSADTEDQKAHFTPANLQTSLHRFLETKATALILKKIFKEPSLFVHHPPLPTVPLFSDEGSANHSRFCASYSAKGVEFFVYGREGSHSSTKFPARQSEMAFKITAFRHKLRPDKTVFATQNPQAIDAGAFHNDVLCVADQNLIFFHEKAFLKTQKVLQEIEEKLDVPLLKIKVREQDIPLHRAISSYLFNSQLLCLKKGEWFLLAPTECQKDEQVRGYLHYLSQNSPIKEIAFSPLRQSMKNGGGPACLRFRVVLTEKEAMTIPKGVCLSQKLYEQIKSWIKKHYRDRIQPQDLLDPDLMRESQTALDELSQLLALRNIYSFQN